MRHAGKGIFLTVIALVMVLTAACQPASHVKSSPRETYDAFRLAVGRGNWEAVFPLMLPEVRDNITRTWSIQRKTAMLIEDHIPPALKQNFLAEIGPREIREAATPQAYFATVMKMIYPVSMLPVDGRHNIETSISRIDETSPGSRNFIITTAAGKKVRLMLCPDNTYAVKLPEDQINMFNNNFTAAGELLADVTSIIESLGQETGKVPR